MSETGPGKPYSKTPEGSTGALDRAAGADVERPPVCACGANTGLPGMGMGADAAGVVDTVVVVVDIVFVSSLRSERRLYMLAVMAAPAPALAAAMIASVVFDIVNSPRLPGS